MKRILLPLMLCLLLAAGVVAQQRDRYATDALVIARMAQKLHVQPRPMDISFSVQFFDLFLKQLDNDRLIFTQEDINKFTPYRTKLSEEILKQQNGFLKLVTGIYEMRIRKTDSLLLKLLQQPFGFGIDERLSVAEDTSYPANDRLQQVKITRTVKKELMEFILNRADITNTTSLKRQAAITDSLEPVARKKVITTFQRNIQRMWQGATGVTAMVGNTYCESVANTFDPHSAYMPRSVKENFESHLGQRSMRFGFSLEQEEGSVSIQELKPGSAAYKSGQLNAGDKIMSIQWEGKQPIDVSDASVEEIGAMLEESNYGKVILSVKKTDGILRKVELQKESMETDGDENRVKSFLLKTTTYTIGYLSLPAFYTDWNGDGNNVKGCANDVAREILRLKKEGIKGLILDLRYNGGGSMQEAVELSGIFIDAGPVAQLTRGAEKPVTLKDVNRGTVYDGPLIILVNGASASASEMVAGTLQDYHRAVIMGRPTYGKATGQVILPLDTLIRLDKYEPDIKADAFLKLTIEKLYRITGSTAQGNGVIPDIQLPDLVGSSMPHESDEPAALSATVIEANKYYKPYPADSLSFFVYRGRSISDTAAWSGLMKKNAASVKELTVKKDISLKLSDALQQKTILEANEKMINAPVYTGADLFVIQNTLAEEQKLKLVPGMEAVNGQWKKALQQDPWIATAFRVLAGK